MKYSSKLLNRFKSIHFKKCGTTISDEDANSELGELATLVSTIALQSGINIKVKEKK